MTDYWSTILTLLCASGASSFCLKSRRRGTVFSVLVVWLPLDRGQSPQRLCGVTITGLLQQSQFLHLLQSFFCTFSWFFWNFWWTTFKVVRKFPRNRTRNVSASMKTCKDTLISGRLHLPMSLTWQWFPKRGDAAPERSRESLGTTVLGHVKMKILEEI